MGLWRDASTVPVSLSATFEAPGEYAGGNSQEVRDVGTHPNGLPGGGC